MKLKNIYNRYKRNKDIIEFLDDAQIYEEDNYTAKYYSELNQEEASVTLLFNSYEGNKLFSISVYDNHEQSHYIYDDVNLASAKFLELLSKFDNAYTIAEKKYILMLDSLLNKDPLFKEFNPITL